MTTLSRLERWKENGTISDAQFDAIVPLVRKNLFSVFVELNGLLFLGVMFFIGGVGWTIQAYFASVGDAAIIAALTLLLVLSFYYCFSRGRPYSPDEVESPNIGFDYILYAGCLLIGLEFGYLETRFHLLQNFWDLYLLMSSVLFFALAYRFDNRLVLSLALSTLAGWFGLRISQFSFENAESLRAYALLYGGVVSSVGTFLYRLSIKKHFLETYLHVAANVMFVALLSGVVEADATSFYLAGLLALAAVSFVEGVRYRRFAFVAYAMTYGYIGTSFEVLRGRQVDSTFFLTYLVVSGSLIILAMILLARSVAREE
jgi:hypothetical protein